MQMKNISQRIILLLSFSFFALYNHAQVNTVEFGKNRLQYKKFKWKFYQSENFNTYVAQGGTELGKFVAQVAEEELPELEAFIEYSLQRKGDIVVYSSYEDYKQSNIGLGNDWQQTGGLTKLVNNKIVVYYDGNHAHLKQQIREGIAKVLTDNILFGDDIGEIASNQALLDLPKWLTDGYVLYAAQNWSTEKDDELKNVLLGSSFKNFYQFAYQKPLLAGHAFWQYFAEKYKKENVTYFLYLARVYKSLNAATAKVCKVKKFKEVLADFMTYREDKYYEDIRKRKNVAKGKLTEYEDVRKNEYFNFQVNPNPKNNTYARVEYKKGIYSVKLNENLYEDRVLLSRGVRLLAGDHSPNYPVMAWDGKGTRLLVIYWEKGKMKMFVWDYIAAYKKNKQIIEGVDQILDASYMLDANTVILSAVKNGHSDIYIYKIDENKLEQVTNDVYDDLNPTYVTFPNRSGIIFSSNRPSSDAPSNDTVLPSKYRFNVFLVDILNKSATKQITQLTNVKFGNATYPMQYNVNHFTFISDENGIGNRYAGFFSTQRNGLDTLYYVGDELLRNPSPNELDSTLAAWRKQEADSISYFQVYKDSTYTFPLTNYQSSIQETRIAGNNGLVSEVRREGDYKYLYKMKIDEQTLTRRNVNPALTNYMQQVRGIAKAKDGKATKTSKGKTAEPEVIKINNDSAKTNKKVFQTEFEDEKEDSSKTVVVMPEEKVAAISKMKLHNYLMKFGTDYIVSGITNNVLINRYQPYTGGTGPIQLNNGSDANWSFRVGTSDLLEDVKFIGGYRFGSSLSDKDAFFSFYNLKRMIDWGATYYRSTSTQPVGIDVGGTTYGPYNGRFITNLYQGYMKYPIDETKSVRLSVAFRADKIIAKAEDQISLQVPAFYTKYLLNKLEYVYDNSLNPAQNIWKGMRYKAYMDFNLPIDEGTQSKFSFNFGFDFRKYVEIYRNFIWAGRAAGDFSWGDEKILYYLGGVDGWISPKFNNANQPAQDQTYSYQSLTLNMRGFNQNVANGNNAVIINSEFRLPVFATFIKRPINNAFLRNFQITQFIDLGTAWNGKYNDIQRPYSIFTDNANNPVTVKVKAGGIGPFVGGYGFGLRSTLLSYFIKGDLAWEMNGFFRGKPVFYFALGLDF